MKTCLFVVISHLPRGYGLIIRQHAAIRYCHPASKVMALFVILEEGVFPSGITNANMTDKDTLPKRGAKCHNKAIASET